MSYRYIRLEVTKRRGGGSGYIQLSEIEFIDRNGNKYAWPSETKVTSSQPAELSEDATKLIDGLLSTKYCGSTPGNVTFDIDLGELESIDLVTFNTWRWYTANDYNSRDPISFSLYISSDGESYTQVDSVSDASIPTTRQAIAYTGSIEFPYDKRYLIGDANEKLYTIEDNALVELEETTLTKALFMSDGVEDVPNGSLLIGLNNPKVFFWQDSSDTLPVIHMSASQTPKPQVVITGNIFLMHSTIVGVENVTIDSDDNTLFAMSFDDGATWWNYVNDTWGLISEELSGQTRESIEAIGTNAWAEKITAGGMIKFRFILSGDGYVDNITVHYLN